MYLTAALQRKEKELKKTLEAIGKIDDQPYNRVRFSNLNGHPRCYFIPEGGSRDEEIYIKVKDRHKVGPLVELDYKKKLREAVEKQLSLIKQMLSIYDDSELIRVYTDMSEERKACFDPLIPDDDLYAQKWLSVPYQKSSMPFRQNVYVTERGENVRSKSEMLIADRYLKQGIPYRYEYPVILKDGKKIVTYHPDFTLLNKRTRQIFYHEHFGKMDDPAYCQDQLDRIELYKKNDIYPGQQLLITHETSERPLDLRSVDRMIEHYLR